MGAEEPGGRLAWRQDAPSALDAGKSGMPVCMDTKVTWEVGRPQGLREGDMVRMGIGRLGDSRNLGIGVERQLMKTSSFPAFPQLP